MSQVAELAKPFPADYVHQNPSGGGSYVKHHVVNQRAIQIFGRPPSFEKVEIVYGDVAAIPPNPSGSSKRAKEGRDALKQVLVGVIARMTVVVDGEKVVVEEAGDCESPHNWDSDGQRLKDAMSDAYKRCAMRLGLGLHLWSQKEYFLYDVLTRDQVSAGSAESSPQEPVAEPKASEVHPSPSSGPNQPAASQPSVSADIQAEEETGGSVSSEARPPSSSWEPSAWDDLTGRYGEELVYRTANRVAKELKDGLVPIRVEMLSKCSQRVFDATAEILAKDAPRQPAGVKS